MPQLSDFLSNFSGVSSGLASATTSLQANEPIVQGDIVVQASDGLAYYAVDQNLPFASMRPITQGVAAYNQQVLATTTLSAVSSVNSVTFPLVSGNTGLVYTQANKVFYTVLGVNGAVVTAPLTLVTDYATGYPVTAVPLSGGGFALAYTNVSSIPALAIFGDAGGVVSASAAIGTATIATTAPLKLCQLSGGKIVIHFLSTSSFYIAMYSATGTPSLAPTVVPKGGAMTLCGTGFVLGFGGGTGSSAAATVYSSLGASVGTVTSTTTVTGSVVGAVNILAIPLSNGNAAILVYYGLDASSVTGMVGLIISPTGASVSNAISMFSGSGIPVAQATPLADGGFAAFQCAGILFAQRVSAAGALVGSAVTIDNTVSMTSTSLVRAAALSDGGMAVAYAAAAGAIKLARLTPAFLLAATATTTTVLSDNPVIVSAQLSLPAPPTTSLFLIAGATTSGVKFGIFSSVVLACQPIGVAKATTASAGSVPVQILGAAQTRLTFQTPYAVDARASNPPGQKMSVAGNLAILNGVQ